MNPTIPIKNIGVRARKTILAAYPGAEFVKVEEGFKTDGGWMPCKTNALTARRLRALRDQGFAILNLVVSGPAMVSNGYPDFPIVRLIKG